jgi:hypothetical protein
MTESEWQSCTDPTPMLEFLRGKVSDRKLRLLVIADVRRVWSDSKISETQEAWKAIEVAERYADIIDADRAERCRLARDIFGNPFRAVTVAASSRSAPILTLAQAIYDNRDFDRLPELADALEQAGCANQEILDHCRQPGPHVRGCWVVDLVLGKQYHRQPRGH